MTGGESLEEPKKQVVDSGDVKGSLKWHPYYGQRHPTWYKCMAKDIFLRVGGSTIQLAVK